MQQSLPGSCTRSQVQCSQSCTAKHLLVSSGQGRPRFTAAYTHVAWISADQNHHCSYDDERDAEVEIHAVLKISLEVVGGATRDRASRVCLCIYRRWWRKTRQTMVTSASVRHRNRRTYFICIQKCILSMPHSHSHSLNTERACELARGKRRRSCAPLPWRKWRVLIKPARCSAVGVEATLYIACYDRESLDHNDARDDVIHS